MYDLVKLLRYLDSKLDGGAGRRDSCPEVRRLYVRTWCVQGDASEMNWPRTFYSQVVVDADDDDGVLLLEVFVLLWRIVIML